MRILIVDINFDYKNIMYRQFYNQLSYNNEVDFFGPGYVSREILDDGIFKFLESKEYSALILGLFFVYSANIEGMRYDAYAIHRNVIPYYSVNDAYQCCRKIFEQIKNVSGIIKIFHYIEDNVFMPLADYRICEELIDNGFWLMGEPLQMMSEYSHEIRSEYSMLTNQMLELAKHNFSHYIPITMHAISYHEIFYMCYSLREYDWCVPGNRSKNFYPMRGKIYNELQEKGYKCWEDDPYQKLSVNSIAKNRMNWYVFRNREEKILSKFIGKNIYVSSYPKMDYIAVSREKYLESMRRTKAVFVEGGIGNVLVRKYFEACASGALMVGMNVPGMDAMGFRDGYNCRIVNSNNINEKIEEIMENRCDNEKIAINGRKLILDKHMFANRALSLRQTIDAIMKKNYQGAYWNQGDYIIKNS